MTKKDIVASPLRSHCGISAGLKTSAAPANATLMRFEDELLANLGTPAARANLALRKALSDLAKGTKPDKVRLVWE